MKKDITELFCFIDDFCNELKSAKTNNLLGECCKPTRTPELEISEIATIVLLYQYSPCKNFKYFYQSYLQLYKPEFPKLVSYNRFIELKPRAFPYLLLLMKSLLKKDGRLKYIDATSFAVCHNKRIYRHKVFKGLAARGKTSMGWFFGLKLHLLIDEQGEIINFTITPGNVDDRKPVRQMLKGLKGLLFGDKGYIDKELFADLFAQGLKLVTGIKKNMKNKLMSLLEKILLRKRSISETVFDYLKNKMSILHTRHRSITNAMIHIISTLVVYALKPTKPSISMPISIPN